MQWLNKSYEDLLETTTTFGALQTLRKISKYHLISRCEKLANRQKFCENYAFLKNLNTRKLGETLVFCPVKVIWKMLDPVFFKRKNVVTEEGFKESNRSTCRPTWTWMTNLVSLVIALQKLVTHISSYRKKLFDIKYWYFLITEIKKIIANKLDLITSLLPPIRAAEIVECVRTYIDGFSQNLQSLNSY